MQRVIFLSTQLNISELDFDNLVESLTQSLKSNPELQDYNYAGSALSLILSVLGHDTYYKSFYLNQLFNELFLDSAMMRGSVVSRAKELGYVPKSARSSRALISVSLISNDFSKSFVIIPRFTRFTGTYKNQTYVFSTGEDVIVKRDTNGFFTASFYIYEGDIVKETHTVPSYDTNTYTYQILNKNIDLDSLTVFVKDNASSTNGLYWKRATDILSVAGTSLVYFVQENINEYYELVFGDGILGKKLQQNNNVVLSYRASNGSSVNGCRFFTQLDQISGISGITINTIEIASGGSEVEDIESIRFNAPKNYDRQDRLVVSSDFQGFIKENISGISDVNVWNGAENDVPMYGKVCISVKPTNGLTLSQTQKNQISSVLKPFQIITNQVQFVDPAFTYIIPTIGVKYDSLSTSLSSGGILSNIANCVKKFENDVLGNFKSSFYHSQFVQAISDVDPSILGNNVNIEFQKRFSPVLNSTQTYIINFHQPLYLPYIGSLGAVNSSGFTLPLYPYTIYIDDDGNGNLRTYYLSGKTRIYVPYEGKNQYIGTVDYLKGLLKFTLPVSSIIDGEEIQINVVPAVKDIVPVKNELLLITHCFIELFDKQKQIIVASGYVNTLGDSTSLYQNCFLTSVVV